MSGTAINAVTLSPIELYLGYVLPFTALWALIGSMGNNRKRAKSTWLPKFSPPPWVYGVVWPLLYATMSISFWLVRMQSGDVDDSVKSSYILYWVLCGMLAVWTWLYFTLFLYSLSVVWILGCLGVAIATCCDFFIYSDVAGAMMIPLCLWLAYASAINFSSALYYSDRHA